MDAFEGYSGIGWANGLLVQDILMFMLLVLLALFAYTFYTCYPLFVKMLRGLMSVKERQNLFDSLTKESVFYNVFMGAQTLFLVSICFFLVFCRIVHMQDLRVHYALALLLLFFVLLVLFYLLKRFLYYIYSRVFASKGKYSLWKTTYHTLFNISGIFYYLPVLWLMLDHNRYIGAMILFFCIYVLFRITEIYIKIRIFYHKNNGFLYLILYLCALEIVPLLFLYESISYLHNVIEASIVWQ